MPSSWEALSVLLVLLPGFVSVGIVDSLFVRPKRSEFDKVAEALIFSFLVYIVFSILFPGNKIAAATPFQLLALVGVSVGFGIFRGATLHHDWPARHFRKLGFSQRTSSHSVWNDTFARYSGFVQVELQDGRQVLGWLRFFSDEEDRMSLFLEEPVWVDKDGNEFSIDSPGLLLTKESGIQTIMFLNPVIKEKSVAASSKA